MILKRLIAPLAASLALLAVPASSAPPSPRGSEIRVSTNTLASHYDPSVAVFPDGGFVVVWTAGPRFDEPVGRRVIHARLFDSQGKPETGEFRLIDPVPGSQFPDRVVADRDGSFLLVWTEQSGSRTSISVRRFNRDGTPRGKRIRVHNGAPSWRDRGVVAVAPDGRFAVAWQQEVRLPSPGSYTNAVARIFTAQGSPLTPEFILGQGETGIGDDNVYAYPTELVFSPDGKLTSLVQYYVLPNCLETELVQFSSDGSTRESQRLGPTFNCVRSDYSGSSLAMSRNGSLIAAWSEYEIEAQRFAPNGEPRADQFTVSPAPGDNFQRYPAVAAQDNGSFVIVWTDEEGKDGSFAGIFGRAFGANGAPLAQDFLVNKTIAGYQYVPDLAALPGGGYVAVWGQIALDGRANIFARVIRP
jgi:hypothetical protein